VKRSDVKSKIVARSNSSMIFAGSRMSGPTHWLTFEEVEAAAEIRSAFVTRESKDGLKCRSDERKTRNGQLQEEIKGDAGRGRSIDRSSSPSAMREA
jgi:hypothetical protein